LTFQNVKKKVNETICYICQNNFERTSDDYFNFLVKTCLGHSSLFDNIFQTSVLVEIPGDFLKMQIIIQWI